MDVTCALDKQGDQMPAWHRRFLLMLPRLRRAASFRFRTLSPARRQDLVNEVIGTCYGFYARLVEKRQEERAHVSTLVQFAAAQLGQGRQLGSRLCARDVSSDYCRRRQGIQLERLDVYNDAEGRWKEVLLADKRASPADLAILRIDFAAWLASMSALRREIAQFLSVGETTLAAAQRFAVSPGRISQLRREFQESWIAFQGEAVEASAAAA
jgi:hypothetical protein